MEGVKDLKQVKVIKKGEGEVVLKDEDTGQHFLVLKCSEKELCKESGWYIRRIWIDKPNCFDWRDFSEPGWGCRVHWIKKDVAQELGLE